MPLTWYRTDIAFSDDVLFFLTLYLIICAAVWCGDFEVVSCIAYFRTMPLFICPIRFQCTALALHSSALFPICKTISAIPCANDHATNFLIPVWFQPSRFAYMYKTRHLMRIHRRINHKTLYSVLGIKHFTGFHFAAIFTSRSMQRESFYFF